MVEDNAQAVQLAVSIPDASWSHVSVCWLPSVPFGELRVARPDSRSTFRSGAYALSKILHGLENSLRVLDPFAEDSLKEFGAL